MGAQVRLQVRRLSVHLPTARLVTAVFTLRSISAPLVLSWAWWCWVAAGGAAAAGALTVGTVLS